MFLKKLTVLSVVLLMVVQLCALNVYADGFVNDLNSYTLDANLNGQDSWVAGGDIATTTYYKVVADPTNANNKCIYSYDMNSSNPGGAFDANRSFTAVDGVGSDNIVIVEYKFLSKNVQGYESGLRIKSGTKTVIEVTSKYTTSPLIGLNQPAIGQPAGTATRVFHQLSYPNASWTTYKFVLNLTTQTFDAYVGGTLPTTPTIANIPFYSAGITSINSINLYQRSYGNNVQNYYDDFSIANGPAAVPAGTFAIDSATANYTVSGDNVAVTANVTMPTVGTGEASVIAAAYDADGVLVDVDMDFVASQAQLVGGVIPFTSTLTGGANVASVKLFLWNSVAGMTPLSASVDCTIN